MKKGMFITFEGCDGCGKTTQLKMLERFLVENGKDVFCTKEPGGTLLGESLRSILKYADYEICPRAEVLLFNASRAQICQDVIAPKLKQGTFVLCDRFYHSSIVYQGFARGENPKDVESICKYALGGIEPDIVFWLDITSQEAFKRKGGADKGERIEEAGDDFHAKVYQGYEKLFLQSKSNIIRINASSTPQSIFNQIKTHILPLLS